MKTNHLPLISFSFFFHVYIDYDRISIYDTSQERLEVKLSLVLRCGYTYSFKCYVVVSQFYFGSRLSSYDRVLHMATQVTVAMGVGAESTSEGGGQDIYVDSAY